MNEILIKNSSIIKAKSKFFINRGFTYAAFLLVPVWIPKLMKLNLPLQMLMIIIYILFICGQWFLLGKEIDHRFKIYFKVNSSLDRVVYRMILGMIVMIVYFGMLGTILPSELLKHFYWGTWIVLGLFYSWPTRGKIIEETMSRQFIEFKFLDPFEKLLIFLLGLFTVVSLPKIPSLEDVEAIKLFLDQLEGLVPFFGIFFQTNNFPFFRFPELYKLALYLHFYFIGLGFFLLVFYVFLRFFISRRLALLGIFTVISAWYFYKFMNFGPGATLSSTFSLYWMWVILWCSRSSTYWLGLFLGLVGFFGVILNQHYFFLLPIQLLVYYFLFLEEKTFWFKRQFIRYSMLGFIFSILILILNYDFLEISGLKENIASVATEIISVITQKDFLILAPIGFILLALIQFRGHFYPLRQWGVNEIRVRELLILFLIVLLYAFFIENSLLEKYSVLWILIFFSLIPLELIFQSARRFSTRNANFIFVVYILICLLDSHFEGRIKGFIDMFYGK
ncbi:MAG: hypothetical protein HQK51_18415 [Oligoflexia bacterium]|nr:hypothetical protein [Oligoflexia bacterium]